jgi:SanA protein
MARASKLGGSRSRRLALARRLALGLGLLLVGLLGCDAWISLTTRVHREVTTVPERPVALVLGTARLHDGRLNRFYTARIDAAAELFAAGKVRGLLVSGDNGRRGYNEPEAMRQDLIAKGVPEAYITCDFAGFRTLDSMQRARRVFGLERVTIVSQPFHAERAAFLARRCGLDAVAFGAEDPAFGSWAKVRLREVAARALAVWDVCVGTRPRFLGEPEAVALRPLR